MDNVIKIKEYMDYTIQYNASFNQFEAVKDGEVRLNDKDERTLEGKIQNAIKRQEKLQSKTKFPIDVIHSTYSTPTLGKITSITEDGDVWFSYVEKKELKRKKITMKYGGEKFYTITEKNKAIVQKHTDLTNAIEKLSEQRAHLSYNFESPLDINSLINPE